MSILIRSKVLVIIGPTASGKSDLAIKLARRFNGEIVSADSRQIYRGMDIGTGKVTKKEQRMAKHHLLDVADPKNQFTVDDFVRLGRKTINDIVARGKLPIICGGTGLYVDALIYDMPIPQVPPDLKLRTKLEKLTVQKLFSKLERLDPERAKTIDPHNPRRLIRALEIVLSTGKPVPVWSKSHSLGSKSRNVLWLGINPGKKILAKRIEKRLNSRLKQGMVKEVVRLHQRGVSWKRLDRFGLEYRHLARFLRARIHNLQLPISSYRADLLRDIIRYSKRQMTWFKRNPKIQWLSSAVMAKKSVIHFLNKKPAKNI